jgi:hypothetical protein
MEDMSEEDLRNLALKLLDKYKEAAELDIYKYSDSPDVDWAVLKRKVRDYRESIMRAKKIN